MKLINHINFSTKHQPQDYYQSIYSSQSYGTFFIVYANFKTTEDENNYYVKEIKLKIINYKGLINIGIENASFIKEFDADDISLGGTLKITLKALDKDEADVHCCDENHPFPKNNSYLFVDRKLSKMHPQGVNFENGIFDEEFFYRDGINEDSQGNVNIASQERQIEVNIDDNQYSAGLISLGTPRCPRSRNKII